MKVVSGNSLAVQWLALKGLSPTAALPEQLRQCGPQIVSIRIALVALQKADLLNPAPWAYVLGIHMD